MRSPAPTRRGLLLGGSTLGVGLLAGCVSSPTVRGGSAAVSSAPSAPPDPALVQARDDEQRLVTLLAAALAAPTAPRSPAQTAALKQLQGAHVAHLALLGHDEPLQPGGAPSPQPAATPAPDASDWKTLSGKLAALEMSAQQHHRQAALAAADDPTCLLYASLSAFAGLNATPGRPVVAGGSVPSGVEVGSRADALGVLLSRWRALAEGLEIGIGQLPDKDPALAPGRQRLVAVWAERDRTAALLRQARQDVAPAELNYQMPGTFTSPAEIGKTWTALEAAVYAAWARLAAASTGAERATALDAMAAQAARAYPAGSPVPYWPGWV
ncbi:MULTISPECIES: DUF4439 domain-containing protein [unclassified Luteococcus]|uniref:DUF4439 domain-containing protein n=1 Tax=unclassified Luteococcus TaxID=2639923 RepID=UPI00313B7297